MAITKQQFDQLGIQLYYLTPAPGYSGGWYAIEDGIAKKVSSEAGQYLQSIGVQVQQRPASQGVPADTTGGNTITMQSLDASATQLRVRADTAAEEQRVRELNSAIQRGDTAAIERLQPGYTLYNGAFTTNELAAQNQAQGLAVQGGNVVGAGLTQATTDALNKLYDSGYVINPNAQITPQSLDEFLAIAGNEINPYYSSQLKLASDQLKRSLGYSEQQLLQSEADVERKYGVDLRKIGEQAAESGFAQSGLRRREEQELATETQRAIDTARQQVGYQAGTAVGQFTQQFAGLPGYQQPTRTLAGTPQVRTGEATFGRSLGESPYYQLSPEVYSGLVGEQEFARRGAIQTRASELEGASNLQRSLATSLNY